ncbi:hypothetical protein KHA80_20170 [Anaerobacillus sp. HL2]|nr:hypothetical protein KHA80_20170 [Anaerobacillus sp. HL2]
MTKYEVYPSIGVKVSKIVNLADDLALALTAKDIRIRLPIPGKSTELELKFRTKKWLLLR